MASHIKKEIEENLSWCGKVINGQFHFKNAEMAAINASAVEINHETCIDCISRVIDALIRGTKKNEHESSVSSESGSAEKTNLELSDPAK